MRRVATAERDVERLLRDGIDPPDARLLHRFLHDRDETAFETLVDRHGPLVLSLCRRYLRDPRDVEDAFQATFLVLVRKGGDLRDRDALASWLYGVARRVAIRARSNALTRRDRERGLPETLNETPAEPAPPVDDALETLDEELARLPEKYRAPLILCHLKGRTYDQAAAELGWPPGTVRSRTARARALLRGRLTRRGVNASATLPLLRSTPAVPASLVATTVAAVGRFPTSPNGPVAALAQGVITAMSLSSSKLLKLALGLVAGVTVAGSIAFGAYFAQDGPERPKAEQAAKAPTAEVQDKPALKANADEPRELEKKLDRIAELLARPPADLPLATITSGSLDDLTFKAFDTGDVREIEAELLNAYPAYQAIIDRFEGLAAGVRRETDPALRAAAPKFKADLEVAVKPVRLLFARLLRMKVEHENLRQAYEREKVRFNTLWEDVLAVISDGHMTPEYLARFGSSPAKKHPEIASLRRDERLRVDLMRQEIALLMPHVRRLGVLCESMDRRAEDVDRLIKWTREHFKEAQLTIDDAVTDGK